MAADRHILVLGGGGFVGGYLHAALLAQFGDAARVINTTKSPQNATTLALDIKDTAAVGAVVRRERPTHIINLVGIAAPVEAHRDPDLAWELHALAPDRLGRMLRVEAPDCWVLHISSGLVYGRTALDVSSLDESARLDPVDTYAMTKAAGDQAMAVHAADGLKCLRLRPFNHTGPGQSEDFAVPAFAAQIARIKAGLQEPVLKVGNLSSVRDFLDVRNVAEAYAQIVACADDLEAGAIYNVASGTGSSMRRILDTLIQISGVDVTIELDPDQQRPSDLPAIVGNPEALSHDTGWTASRSLDQTLADTLAHFSAVIEASRR